MSLIAGLHLRRKRKHKRNVEPLYGHCRFVLMLIASVKTLVLMLALMFMPIPACVYV